MAAAVRRPSDGSAVPLGAVLAWLFLRRLFTPGFLNGTVVLAAGRVSPFAKAGGQCSFLGQEPPQQTRGQHPERQQRHNRSAAGQRRQVAPVKRQRFRHQVGQRRREHDPARKARAGRQQTLRRRAEHSQQPAQAGGQPGEGGKYYG